MALQSPDQLKHLKTAFQTFNDMSEQLMSSYHLLENQVERLNQELAAAHDDNHEQFERNKYLANRLERLLDALPGGVVVLSGRGIVQETNLAAVELLGEPLKDMEWRTVIQRAFEPQVDDGHDISLKDGRRVSISTSSLGKEPGQILLITDVTDKRLLQDKLGRYQRLSAMGQMAASLAHQIRTPTASALLYLSNLGRNGTNSEAVSKYSEKIREQLRHIEIMVRDMLVYAKGGTDAQASIFTIQELIDSLTQSVQAQLDHNGVTLVIENSVSGIRLKGNREALIGALLNLVMNSLHAKGKQPLKIELCLSMHEANKISITVKDNGIGISSEIQANVFDPFVTTRPQGTGLGLAVVKSVVEKHGGEICLESEQGEGTRVTIIFPVFSDGNSNKTKEEQNTNEVWL